MVTKNDVIAGGGAWPFILVACATLISCAYFLGGPTPDSANALQMEAQLDKMDCRCVAEWTDIGGASHCGHVVKPLGRSNDTLGNPIADIFHCFTDSVRFALPVPRYAYAESGMKLDLEGGDQ